MWAVVLTTDDVEFHQCVCKYWFIEYCVLLFLCK